MIHHIVAEGGGTMPQLMGISLLQGGAAAIVGLVVILILRGALVPRSTLRDLQAERDMWRAAHQASEECRHEDRQQLGLLMEYARTADHVLRSLPQAEGVGDAPPPRSSAHRKTSR
jgi:hypothetical protein